MATIELTNDVLLSQRSVEGITGIDVTNLIASKQHSDTGGGYKTLKYTATEDCIVKTVKGYAPVAYNNGVTIGGSNSGMNVSGNQQSLYVVKKGEEFSWYGGNTVSFNVYGLKK